MVEGFDSSVSSFAAGKRARSFARALDRFVQIFEVVRAWMQFEEAQQFALGLVELRTRRPR